MDQSSGKTRLEIDAAYYNTLDIHSFALMLKDPSYCYKFYWLEAIVELNLPRSLRKTCSRFMILLNVRGTRSGR